MMNEIYHILFHTNEAIFAIVSENVWEAYLLLFLIVFLETGLIVFPFLPGDGLLFSAGVIAASSSMNILILVPILIFAAIIGNHFNYRIGKLVGNRIEHSHNKLVQKYLANSLFAFALAIVCDSEQAGVLAEKNPNIQIKLAL